jgi:hypothetical protein
MTLPATEIQNLRSRLQGQVLAPADEGYDTARTVFNGMIDRHPTVIARCAHTADVVESVNFARDHKLTVSVRCAGHNVGGYAVCDGGLVIDLGPMKKVEFDAASRTVIAGAGLTWGELNDQLQPHEFAAAGGFVSTTGVSGLTLGGGLGWLVRKHGLALDNLLSAEVVTADGRLVVASPAENADLFWALRGGGGNFGIVTSFEFRVHPAGTVLAGIVLHPLDAAAQAIRYWRDFEAHAPEELTQGALLFSFPDDPNAPPPLRGAPVVGIGGVFTGDLSAAEAALRPLRSYGPPVADMFQPTPYNVAQRMADFLWPPGLQNYWKSSYLKSLSDGAIDTLVDYFRKVPSPRTVIVIEHNGDGAMNRVDESATAFGSRGWPYNFLVTSAWEKPEEAPRNMEWTRTLFNAMRPFLADAAYVNYLGDEGQQGVSTAYGLDKYERLVAVKTKYDPTNFFCMNQNIRPAPMTAAGA